MRVLSVCVCVRAALCVCARVRETDEESCVKERYFLDREKLTESQ